jgi:hypothetical protein
MEDYLKYGAIGLCAIVLILCSSIIAKEQKRDGKPRRSILKTLYVFMVFSLVITTAALLSEYFSFSKKVQKQQLTIEKLKKETQNFESNYKINIENMNKEIKRLHDALESCNNKRIKSAQEQINYLRNALSKIKDLAPYDDVGTGRASCPGMAYSTRTQVVKVRVNGIVQIPQNKEAKKEIQKVIQNLEQILNEQN